MHCRHVQADMKTSLEPECQTLLAVTSFLVGRTFCNTVINPRSEHLIILHELAKLRESPSWGSLPVSSLLCFGAGGSPEAGSQSLGPVHTDPAPLEEG